MTAALNAAYSRKTAVSFVQSRLTYRVSRYHGPRSSCIGDRGSASPTLLNADRGLIVPSPQDHRRRKRRIAALDEILHVAPKYLN